MLCVFDGTLPRLGCGGVVEPYILFDLSSFCSFAFIDLLDTKAFFCFVLFYQSESGRWRDLFFNFSVGNLRLSTAWIKYESIPLWIPINGLDCYFLFCQFVVCLSFHTQVLISYREAAGI